MTRTLNRVLIMRYNLIQLSITVKITHKIIIIGLMCKPITNLESIIPSTLCTLLVQFIFQNFGPEGYIQ